MKNARLGVGIVGLTPERSWAAMAHVPAIRMQSKDFFIAGIANSNAASGKRAATACGIDRAFTDVQELVSADEVDVVVVTVRVPGHRAIVEAAIEAGKHVYCEWPLGNGLTEAEHLTTLAQEHGVLGVIGTQARVASEILVVKTLIGQGYIGDVLSSSIIGSGFAWGAEMLQDHSYSLDHRNGATMLTVPFGHLMAAVTDVLGSPTQVSAKLLNRRTSARVIETGDFLPMTAPDQIMVHMIMNNGLPLSLHYRGGLPQGTGFLWEINGTKGDLRLSAANGQIQMMPITIHGGQNEDQGLHPLTPHEILGEDAIDPVSGRVSRIYQRMALDLRNGSSTAPSFADALKLHRIIDAVQVAARKDNNVDMPSHSES